MLIAAMLLVFAAAGARAEVAGAKCDMHKSNALYVVGYAHLDTQWRWTYQDSINTYIPNTMYFNFKLLDKYPDYNFNFTGARRYMMMKEYYPSDYERVKQYIAGGRWHISGSSVDENDANVPSSESIVRHVLYGNRFFNAEFGKTSVDFMLPDCFGFPASLPSALAHAGLKGFSTQKLGWGSAVGVPFNVGVWEGPDGKYVAAALNPGSYTSVIDNDLSNDKMWLDRINDLGAKAGVFADFKYYGTGDVGGSPTEGSVQWLEKGFAAGGPVCLVSGSSDQIFRDLTTADADKLPRYKGDLLLKEHSAGSLTSEAYMKRWNRKNELLADDAERVSVAADWLGAAPYPFETLYNAWLLLLGNQMHDILPGTAVPKAYEFSWNDEAIVMNQFAAALESGAGAIIRGMDTNVEGVPVVVYNQLSTGREDVVQVTVNFPGGAPKFVRVFDSKGKEAPAQVIKSEGGTLTVAFLANLPAVGFKVYDVRKANAQSEAKTGLSVSENTLENEYYVVKINSDGDVASVWDKKAGMEVLAAPARLAFMEDSPRDWPAWNIDWDDWQAPPRAYVGGPVTIKVAEKGPARVALKIIREAEGSKFVQTVRLSAGTAGARIEFDSAVDWRTPATCLKATFPLKAASDKASYNLDLGVVERPNNHAKKYEVPSHEWFDLTDAGGKFGASVLEDSKFGSDKPADNMLRLTLVRTPRCRSYFDQATQDFGRHSILYALAPHSGDWRQGGTQWQAMRLNQPPVAFNVPKHDGLGKMFSFMSVSSPQVAVRALKKAEEGGAVIVRIQELEGKPAAGVRVGFAGKIESAVEVNGQEEKIGDAQVSEGALIVDFKPFDLRAFMVKLTPPKKIVDPPVSEPVALAYDTTAASSDGEKSAGFDKAGHSYPAEMLPATTVVDGIKFNFGPSGAGAKNALACKGQKINLPKGKFNRLYVLAAAAGGDVKGAFKIDGKASAINVSEWTGYVGQWDNRIWKTDREISGLKPAFIKRDEIAWFASHIHNSEGANIAYNYSYIFKYKLDLPAGAKTLMLPDDGRIRVFAVTAAYNENDAASPAQLLYDSFEKPVDAPRVEPSGGKFSDTIKVILHRPWFAQGDELRYTTDGKEPTAKSTLYKGPIWLRNSASFRVRAFSGGKPVGLEAKAKIDVKDTTPPRVESAAALSLAPSVYVKFSEPLDKASAENAAVYKVSGNSVESAALQSDGMTVQLNLTAPSKKGKKYTLTVNGVKDLAPVKNAAKGEDFEFKTASPALYLRFASPDLQGSMTVDGINFSYHTRGKPEIVKGKFGRAMRLNGESDCLVIDERPEYDPTDAITVSAWIRPDDWIGNRRVLQKGDDDNQYRLLKEDNNLVFDLSGVGRVEGPLPAPGMWHHVAGTYDGRTMRLYVDGIRVDEEEASGQIGQTGDSLYIGTKNDHTAKGDYFKGDIDEVMIWNYALAGEHIKAIAKQAENSK